MLGHDQAGNIHVGSAALEGRIDGADGVAPLALVLFLGIAHQADIVAVADGEIADAGQDVARAFAVAARRLARQVGFHALEPGFRLRLAMLGDVGGDERRVVRMLSGADADLAAPLRIGEALIGERLVLHTVLRHVGDARAQGQRVPLPLRIAKLGGNRLVQRVGLDRLRDAEIDRLLQPSMSTAMSRSAGEFVPRCACVGPAVGGEQRVDLDAARLGEGVESRFDEPGSR